MNHQWPSDPDSPSSSSLRTHPRLIAPAYKWEALSQLIANDAYLASWNATIFANATKDAAADSITYELDGGLNGSGVLDPARILKMRIKNWGYAWRMSKDTKWVDRAYAELQVRVSHKGGGRRSRSELTTALSLTSPPGRDGRRCVDSLR